MFLGSVPDAVFRGLSCGSPWAPLAGYPRDFERMSALLGAGYLVFRFSICGTRSMRRAVSLVLGNGLSAEHF